MQVCELLGAALGESRARDVQIVSFSLDPEHDTPAAFAEYAESYGVEGAWSFLTGTPAELDALRRRLGFYDLDPAVDADRTQHAGYVLIGNEPRARWMHLPLNVAPEQIADAVRRVAR